MLLPNYSDFKQQTLRACRPVFTPATVVSIFFVIGIAFIPIGIAIMYCSDEVKETIIDYTLCKETELKPDGNPTYTAQTCAKLLKDEIKKQNSADSEKHNQSCLCVIPFKLDSDFKGKVFMYYGLSNFYQNHRKYVKSFDENQLLGFLNKKPSHDCEPFAYDEDGNAIAPCGAIANSLFSDGLNLKRQSKNATFVDVPLLRTGIAWESDKKLRFNNPSGDLKEAFKKFSKPKNWKKHIWELDEEDSSNNGFKNEDFIVWMRTASTSNFRKLHRRIDHSQEGYGDGLLKGSYQLHVTYDYDVSSFDGSKRMILSTASILGGKNPVLGILYIFVGCVCLILGFVFLFVHLKCGNRHYRLLVDVDADKKRREGHKVILFLKEYVNVHKPNGRFRIEPAASGDSH